VRSYARLRGPGFARPEDWGRLDEGSPYVARPFLEGDPFDRAARRASPETLVRWVGELLADLETLHGQGLVHRDLKSDNVLIVDERPVLVDFDLIAGADEEHEGITGTRNHIAPEVLLGQPHRPAADLFSLGAMLALALAHPASTPAAHRFPRAPFWEAMGLDPSSLPEPLGPLVHALVHRHPNDRPSSAREAVQLLPDAASAPPERKLDFLAGRASFLDRFDTARGRIVVRAHPEELTELAREIHLRLALLGRRTTRVHLVEGTGAHGLDPEAEAILVTVAPRVSTEHLCETVRSIQLLSGSEEALFVLVLPRETGAADAQLWEEGSTTATWLLFPDIDEAALRDHLGKLSDFASPGAAASLAASLHERTRGRWQELNRRLVTAEEDGVLRRQGSSHALLLEAWPAGAKPEQFFVKSLEHLEAEPRRMLAALAALEGLATPPRVRDVSHLEEASFEEALEALLARDVLEPGVGPRGAYLVRDERWTRASLAALAPRELKRLHERCVHVLSAEDLPQEYIAPHRLAIADSAREFSDVLDAADALAAGGRLAAARRLTAATLEHADPRMKAVLARATIQSARLELGQGNAREALTMMRTRFGHELTEASHAALLVAAEAAEMGGLRDLARELFERVLENEPTVEERLRATVGRGYMLLLDGDPHAVLKATSRPPSRGAPDEPAGSLWNVRAGAFAQLGRHVEAQKALDEAMVRASACGDPTLYGRTMLNRGYLDRRRGALPDALEALEKASAAFDRADHVKLRALAANNLGVLLRDLGDYEQSRRKLRESHALRRRIRDSHGAASSLASLGIAELESGRIGAALRSLDRAIELFHSGSHSGEIGFVGTHYAIALSLAGRWEEADELLKLPELQNARKQHALVHARARAARHLAVKERQGAVEVLRNALLVDPPDEESSERHRTAAWLLALEPGSGDARSIVESKLQGQSTPSQRCEALWLTRGPASCSTDELREWIEVFSDSGRVDLVHTLAAFAAKRLGTRGELDLRRALARRAEAGIDALVGELPEADRGAALERIERLNGLADEPFTKKRELDVDWLLSWNRRLAAAIDLKSLLGSTVDMALEVTGATRGFLVMLRDNGTEIRAASGLDHAAEDEVLFSLSVIQEAVRSRRTILALDATHDERFVNSLSVRALGKRAVLCVPFAAATGVEAALYLDDDRPHGGFDEFDERIVRSLTDLAALAVGQIERLDEIRTLNQRLEDRIESREDELQHARSVIRSRGESPPTAGLVGESEAFRALLDQVDRFADTDLPVLLSGPGGSELARVAMGLHDRSARARSPLLTQNPGTIPSDRFEIDLFGHVQSALDNPGRNRTGILGRAGSGTLYLEEVDSLSLAQQRVLLRVLETGVFQPVGGTRNKSVRFRLITSSHKDLASLVSRGEFDRDLYLFINAVEIRVPTLAERVQDIPLLVQRIIEELNAKYGKQKTIHTSVVERLTRRPWMGELRELTNEVTRLYFLADESLEDPGEVRNPADTAGFSDPMPASYRLDDLERAAIARALQASRQQKDKAARLLGISRAGLYTKMRRLGLSEKKPRSASENQGTSG